MVYKELIKMMRKNRMKVVEWNEENEDLNGIIRLDERKKMVYECEK